jgi:hypothetical protein
MRTTPVIAQPESTTGALATCGDSTKRTISKSEALLDFAVLMTEEKVA